MEGTVLRAMPNIILDKWSVLPRQRVIALLLVAECRVTPTVWAGFMIAVMWIARCNIRSQSRYQLSSALRHTCCW